MLSTWLLPYLPLRYFMDGMLVMMVLYGLLLFAQHRKALYWHYSIYILFTMITFRIDDRDYSNADYQSGANYVVTLTEALAFVMYIRFASLLLDVPRHDSRSNQLLNGLVWLVAGHLLFDTLLWLLGVSATIRSGLYVADRVLLVIGALVVVPRLIRLRQPATRYFMVGSLFFVLGCLVALGINYVPDLFTRQPTNAFTYPTTYMQVGVVMEVLCFTLGISLLNRHLESDRLSVQSELVRQLAENEQRLNQLHRIRADIARDLHDDVGADLSTINMLSQAADRQLSQRPQEAQATLRLIGEAARQVLKNMRKIVWNLTDNPDTDAAFADQMRSTAQSLFEHQNVKLHLDLPSAGAGDKVSSVMRRAYFLAYKELLHNALRHASARNIYVALRFQEGVLVLTVRDDGTGFKTEKMSFTGNGLRSLHQRAADLGGQFTIQSDPGAGATMTMMCPLEVPVQEGQPA